MKAAVLHKPGEPLAIQVFDRKGQEGVKGQIIFEFQ
jgi:hypothetical protein